jgi:hypothetical protein
MRPTLEDEWDLEPWDDDPDGVDAHYMLGLAFGAAYGYVDADACADVALVGQGR